MARRNVSTTNPESPAIAALADALEAAVPAVVLETTNNASPGTRHTSGLAIDIMFDVTNTNQRQTAHAIIDVLVARHSRGKDALPSLTWSDLIYSDYDGRTISYFHIPGLSGANGYGGTLLKRNPYTSDTKHGDHIHVDWVDFSLKNPMPEYLHIPYKWSPAAERDEFRATLNTDFAGIAARLPAPTLIVPAWLPGWWKIGWRGDTYFYFFDRGGFVQYTKVPPGKGSTQPPVSPQDKGTYTVGVGNNVTVKWNSTGTVEKFEGGPREMRGIWNDTERFAAQKL